MRAQEIQIHNFRSILDATIVLDDCNSLVGINNSGKTTVIDCIRAFYEKDVKFDKNNDFPKVGKVSDNDSWMEIEFKPSEDELKNLRDEYRTKNNTFRIRKYFKTNEVGADGKEKAGLYAYENGIISDNRFYGFKNVGQGKFGDLIYIPAVSKIDEHTKLSGPSALRELLNSVLLKIMDKSEAYIELKDSFAKFESGIKTEKTNEGYSLESIESDISKMISEWGTEFRLNINPIAPADLVKNLVGHEIFDTVLDKNQSLSAYGQGFQRSFIYSLIRIAAKYTKNIKAPVKKEFAPELTWILFEEPEVFLHPTQISALNCDLRTLADTESFQVLLTTHSPQFVSHNMSELTSICRLQKEKGVSTVYQISSDDLNNILTSNQEDMKLWQDAGGRLNSDDMLVDMESVKYSLWLDNKRCAAFFAERVLLVEGPTETALFSYMIDNDLLPSSRGLYILDTIGKYNIHRFMNLFEAFGIKHFALYDGDGRHEIGQEFNKEIEATIKATQERNKFTRGLDTFPIDLETFLDISSTKRHRKPQHLMYHISKMDQSKLKPLAQKIETLIKQ